MIKISGLVAKYGAETAVDGLTLQVPAGSMYGLLGPNGAGKSTTIHCVAALRSVDAGTITVGGSDVVADPDAVRRRLGVVPQAIALYGELTVTQNLQVFGGLYGLGGKRLKERVAFGVALAQLEDKAKAPVHTLSGGMQRRLNLSCSLLHEPEILICDEPTTGVDPQSRNHLFETIKRLHAQGMTVIYTTHYMEEVEALCDHVAIMDHGRLITDAPLSDLLQGHDSLEQVFLNLTGRALRDGE